MKKQVAVALWVALLEYFSLLGSTPKMVSGQLQQVITKDYCGKSYGLTNFNATIALIPTESSWKPITACMKCPVTLVTEDENHQLLTTFYSLKLKPEIDGTCSQARLDIFDGNTTSEEARLSGGEGICGYTWNSTPYISTNKSLTVELTTQCPEGRIKPRHSVYGWYELIVTTFKSGEPSCPGQFQCRDGQCIQPSMVCDGNSDCLDASDEDGCPSAPTTLPTWAIVILTLLTFAVMVLTAYIIYLVCASICACADKGYEKI